MPAKGIQTRFEWDLNSNTGFRFSPRLIRPLADAREYRFGELASSFSEFPSRTTSLDKFGYQPYKSAIIRVDLH